MGPFTTRPTGIGLIDVLGGIVAAVLVIWAVGYFLWWIWNQGKKSAQKLPLEAPPPGMEYCLVCDNCGAQADQLFRRRDGPDLCRTCFGFPASTTPSTLPASNKTSTPTGPGG